MTKVKREYKDVITDQIVSVREMRFSIYRFLGSLDFFKNHPGPWTGKEGCRPFFSYGIVRYRHISPFRVQNDSDWKYHNIVVKSEDGTVFKAYTNEDCWVIEYKFENKVQMCWSADGDDFFTHKLMVEIRDKDYSKYFLVNTKGEKTEIPLKAMEFMLLDKVRLC